MKPITLQRIKSPRAFNTYGYFATNIVLGLATAALGPTLPALAENTGSTLGNVGILFAARSLGTMLGAWRGGRLFDRLPGNPLIAFVLVVEAALLAIVPISTRLWLLSTILLLIGLMEGVLDVGGNAMLIWLHDANLGPFLNGLHFFYGLGAFLSPIIVAQALLLSGGSQIAYWILALGILPIAIWIVKQPSPQHLDRNSKTKSNLNRPGLIALISFFLFLYVGAEVSYGGWIYSYATTLGLCSSATAAYLTAAFWGGLTLGRLLSIPLASRTRPRTVLLVDLAGCLGSLALMVLIPDSLPVVWIGTIATGLFMASIFPTALAFAEQRIPISGQVTGWFFTGGSAGAMSLPWLVGQQFALQGPQVLLFFLLADLALALSLLFTLILSTSQPIMKSKV
ncbi:MAG: MFS transporter [Anaerolineales bacterium]|jgi:FHS family Na+ dependent glucose MFS transporter 1